MNRTALWTLALAVVMVGACAVSPSENGPDAGQSREALLEQARAIHDRVLVLDAHADTELPDAPSPYVGDDGLSQVDPAKLHAGGVDAVVMSVAVGSGPRTAEGYAAARARAEQEVAAVHALAADPANDAVVARSADEMDEAIREARRDAGVLEDYLYPFELYWEIDDPAARSAFTQSISDLLGPGSVDAMLDHLDYIVDRVGVDHVGIGSDFNHGGGVEGFADAGEALGVTMGLLERGYSEEDIAKIWGGNFLRVLRAAENAAESAEAN